MRGLQRSDYQQLAQLRRAIRILLRTNDGAVKGAGLSPQQYQALIAICGHPGAEPPSVFHVAEQLLIEHHTAV